MISFLHALGQALAAFHRVDPAGWFAWREPLGRSGAVVAILFGAFALFIGAREGIFRVVAVPLGLLLGVALTGPALDALHALHVPETPVLMGLPLGLALLAGFLPQTIAFVTLGSMGALIASAVVPDADVFVAAVPTFLVVGIIGVVLSRVIDTVASAVFGALLLVGGLLVAFPHSAVATAVMGSVWGPTIVAALLAAAGGALQFVMHGDPDAIAASKAQAAEAKGRAKDDRERKKRFASYGKS